MHHQIYQEVHIFFFFFVALDTLLSLRECKVITQSLRLWYVLENELIA